MSITPGFSFANKVTVTKQSEDFIRLAVIGKGRMGSSNLHSSLATKMSRLVAVCDVYEKNLRETAEQHGQEILLTRNYHDIINNNNVDAVIIATPDHLHQQIAIEAMKAGKHVYCEKPVIHKVEEGNELLRAQRENGVIFQTGNQGVSSWGNELARLIIRSGLIGPVNLVEGQFSAPPRILRTFVAPKEANEDTISWDKFQGKAPKRPYDAQRFFQWRGWQDYSTGLTGDLLVHVIASVHYIMENEEPEKVYATGSLTHYLDGSRDLPDAMFCYLDYPNRNNKGKFTLSLQANLVDGISKKWGSTDFMMIGARGSMRVEWDKVTLKTINRIPNELFKGLMSLGLEEPKKTVVEKQHLYEFNAPKGLLSAHVKHHKNFLQAIRKEEEVRSNAAFGVRSATAALLCNESYLKGSPVKWKSEKI